MALHHSSDEFDEMALLLLRVLSQMSQAALSGGQSLGEGGLLLGGETFAWGGGGNPRFPTPLYETLLKKTTSLYCYIVTLKIVL